MAEATKRIRVTPRSSAARRRNVLLRHRGPDDPEVLAVEAEMRRLELEEHVQAVVDGARTADADLLDRLRALLPAPEGAAK